MNLKTKKETVNKVDVLKKKLVVNTKNNNNESKKYICDLVINVSGPLNPKTIKNEIPLVKSLKKNGVRASIAGGFFVNNDFKIIGGKIG